MKKKRKADAIISGDWHLMEEERTPPCRLDSIWEAQWNKVEQIKDLQEKHESPFLFLSGDLLDHWKTSPNLLNKIIKNMPPHVYSVIGNHDMPQHNIENIHKSGINTLFLSDIWDDFDIFYPYSGQGHWGREKKITPFQFKNRKIIVSHEMAYEGEPPYPGAEGEYRTIFKKYTEADLIITGHNHKTFVSKSGNRLLINPGSLTRHDADQMDHKPCVFLWYAEDNSFDVHYLKINENAMSREHIEDRKRKEKQINDFMEKLQGSWKVSLSFEENIERALEKNKVPQSIKEIILKWVGK